MSRGPVFGQPRFLAGPQSPTADLYLGFSLAGAIAAGRVRRLAPTVFLAGEALIVMRHLAGLGLLPRYRRLIYLIDDDIPAGLRDRALPRAYRAKLAALELPALLRCGAAADAVVATSPALVAQWRARHPGKTVIGTAPAWPVAEMPAPRSAAPLRRIALIMGRSHARDAAPLWAPLLALLDRRTALGLTVSGNLDLPAPVRSHPRVDILTARGWADYLGWLRIARADIGLVPHFASRDFNAARSGSKLGEYAMTGAAVLGAEAWAEGRAAAAAGRCLAVPPDPAAWVAAIERLAEAPDEARALAARNRSALIAEDACGRQQRLWSDLLGMDLRGVPAEPG
ncbi:hypothetical protein [Rhodovulum sulfidophilum]|uniref:Glycosyltransferase family 4 protein n=1 Tax=Rhodovulum sulfidophilum TaxID=35806 RepID=A0ABS1RQF3_RHOSU|nr:hypothetical protein [Rhodovulum sulfidophilum]MBL3608299.1 hypothetical protein [Rhodovulum sulfidophilum]